MFLIFCKFKSMELDRATKYRSGHGDGGARGVLHDARADRVEVPRAAGRAGGPGVSRRRSGRMRSKRDL